MKERGGSEAVRINNLDEMIRPGSVMIEGELMFQIERPVLNARESYGELGDVYSWDEMSTAAPVSEVMPEARAAAD